MFAEYKCRCPGCAVVASESPSLRRRGNAGRDAAARSTATAASDGAAYARRRVVSRAFLAAPAD